jgi:hypothetical protein
MGEINYESQTKEFIKALTGDADAPIAWRALPEKTDDPSLRKKIYGPFSRVKPQLEKLNKAGAGIFIVINKTDAGGQKDSNVTGLTALFVDNDEQVKLESAVAPSIRIKTARGEHLYWLLEPDEPLNMFEKAQKALARHFGTDQSVSNLSRIMRVPGFYHCKKTPTMVMIESARPDDAHTIDQLLDDLGIDIYDSGFAQDYQANNQGQDFSVEPSRFAKKQLAAQAGKIALQGEGGRHTAIFAAAAEMGSLVAAKQISAEYVKEHLTKVAQLIGNNGGRKISDDEISRTIDDGLSRGSETPTWDDAVSPEDVPEPPEDYVSVIMGGKKPDDPPKSAKILSMVDALCVWDDLAQLNCVPTQVKSLNQILGGGYPIAQVSTLIAYTGGHKSEFVRHSGRHAALNGFGVVHVDVELGAGWIVARTLSEISGVSFGHIKDRSKRTEEETVELVRARERLAEESRTKIIPVDGGMPILELEACIKRAVNDIDSQKGTLVILDSAQRLSCGVKAESQRIQVQNFMNWAEAMAKRLKVAVVVVSEQKRSQDGKKPTAEDLLTSGAESRSLEFVPATMIGLIPDNTPSDEVAKDADEVFEKVVSILVAKNRHGSIGYAWEDMVFLGPCWRYRTEPRGLGNVADEVVEFLSDGETKSTEAIRRGIKRKKSAVRAALVELNRLQTVDKVTFDNKSTCWRLTPQKSEKLNDSGRTQIWDQVVKNEVTKIVTSN